MGTHVRDGTGAYVNLLDAPQAHQIFPLDFESAFFCGSVGCFYSCVYLSNLRVQKGHIGQDVSLSLSVLILNVEWRG